MAAFNASSPFNLLRRGPSDSDWDVLTTAYFEPVAVAVAGTTVVTAGNATHNGSGYLDVTTATGTGAPSLVPGLPVIGGEELAIDALADGTIALLTTSVDYGQVFAAIYANGVWNMQSAPALTPTQPSVRLRANGTAVVSWLHSKDVPGPPGGPSFFGPVHHIAFLDASSTGLTSIPLTTMSGHASPQVAWLDDTHVIASHSEAALVVQVVSTDGTIVRTADPRGRLDGTAGTHADVALLPNGDAIATWLHSGSFLGTNFIAVARYVDGAWQPVEAIAELAQMVPPQIEPLPDNTALLTFAETPQRGVAIVVR